MKVKNKLFIVVLVLLVFLIYNREQLIENQLIQKIEFRFKRGLRSINSEVLNDKHSKLIIQDSLEIIKLQEMFKNLKHDFWAQRRPLDFMVIIDVVGPNMDNPDFYMYQIDENYFFIYNKRSYTNDNLAIYLVELLKITEE